MEEEEVKCYEVESKSKRSMAPMKKKAGGKEEKAYDVFAEDDYSKMTNIRKE